MVLCSGLSGKPAMTRAMKSLPLCDFLTGETETITPSHCINFFNSSRLFLPEPTSVSTSTSSMSGERDSEVGDAGGEILVGSFTRILDCGAGVGTAGRSRGFSCTGTLASTSTLLEAPVRKSISRRIKSEGLGSSKNRPRNRTICSSLLISKFITPCESLWNRELLGNWLHFYGIVLRREDYQRC